MTYDPHKPMSPDFLNYFLRITRKNGYHCVIPYGWKLADKAAYIHDTLRPPLYDGWTFRVFFYAMDPVQSDTAVQVAWNDIDPSYYVIRAVAQGGRPSVTGYTHNADISDQFVANDIKQGEYFSLAIQIDGEHHNFRGLFNDLKGNTHSMSSISNVTKWHYKITPSLNVITSIHVYDNLATAFPEFGLGEEFLLQPVRLGVGSYGIFDLKYGSGSGDLTIAFNDENQRRSHHYDSAKLTPGEIFTVYIRNTPVGWLIYPSFQATPDLLVHEFYDSLISPIFSPAGILMMNMESSY
ncbi:uncharacterized protein [Dermacentor andersoni]|uniref:uncharacterized protein isoform X1 n=2 Tax=Dermacentor andersoni TaxID=34620 RepID=UPI002415F2D3|nr:uncharacterized protein LOC129385710 isoform X1 [Dermacentor andersoni]